MRTGIEDLTGVEARTKAKTRAGEGFGARAWLFMGSRGPGGGGGVGIPRRPPSLGRGEPHAHQGSKMGEDHKGALLHGVPRCTQVLLRWASRSHLIPEPYLQGKEHRDCSSVPLTIANIQAFSMFLECLRCANPLCAGPRCPRSCVLGCN